MTERPSSSATNERLEAAAAWHARLEGDVSEQDWQAFTAWLEADPRNRAVFDAVDAVNAEVGHHLTSAPVIMLGSERQSRFARLAKPIWAAAALAAALLLAVVLPPALNGTDKTQTLATAVGEQRDVTLDDGSTVRLNTNTSLSVSFSRKARIVRLNEGEALFDVTKDPERVFSVVAGDRHINVVGTAFNVLRHEGGMAVTVERGVVQVVHDTGAPTAKYVKLSPGDRYSAREGSSDYRLAKIDPAMVSAWRDGKVVFDDAPLSEVVTSLNRYFKRPIVISDAAVRDLRFSGILKIDDQTSVVRRLEALLPITGREGADAVVLERGSSK